MNALPWPFRLDCRAEQTDAPEPPAHAPVPTHVGNRALDSRPAPGPASGRWASAVGEHLSSVTKPTIASLPADATAQVRRDEGTKWRRFGLGLAVRLFGLVLIWLGDGSPSVFRKALVVLGVVLSIGGIAVLRYLLISGFRRSRCSVWTCAGTMGKEPEDPTIQSAEPPPAHRLARSDGRPPIPRVRSGGR